MDNLTALDTENMMVGDGAVCGNSHNNQSTIRRLSGPINCSAKHFPAFKPTAAVVRRLIRPSGDAMIGQDRWTMVGTEGDAVGDDGDSEVERFNFEKIQISYSSPSLPLLDMQSISPPAAKLFHCEAAVSTAVSPKRRPLKHHNHQRLQRPCLDFDKMQQVR